MRYFPFLSLSLSLFACLCTLSLLLMHPIMSFFYSFFPFFLFLVIDRCCCWGAPLQRMSFSPQAKRECEEKAASLRESLAQLTEEAEALTASLSQFDFQFASPVPNFDRSRIFGMVAKLVRVKDPQVRALVHSAISLSVSLCLPVCPRFLLSFSSFDVSICLSLSLLH